MKRLSGEALKPGLLWKTTVPELLFSFGKVMHRYVEVQVRQFVLNLLLLNFLLLTKALHAQVVLSLDFQGGERVPERFLLEKLVLRFQ